MHLNDIHLRERFHGVVKVAEWGLVALGCLVYPLVLLMGSVLGFVGFRISPWLGITIVLVSIWLIHSVRNKQRETRDLLERVDAVVQGSTQQLKEFLHQLVDQLLSTLAHVCSILPLLLFLVMILLVVSHHGGASGAVLLILVTTMGLGCCLYGVAHRCAWKHVDSLVDAIMEESGDSSRRENDETSRLL